MDHIARHLSISGVVQGVGYRYATCQEARRLGLNGWVRNRRDGSVEAVVAGPPAAVEALITWARRGPPAAVVHQVDVQAWSAEVAAGFEQTETI